LTAPTVLIHVKSSGFYKRVADIKRIVVDLKKAIKVGQLGAELE
jgi:hypothetical protein